MADFYSDIYNQETKERFMDSINLDQYPPRWWERVFEKSYFFEKLKDKDLHSFSTPDIIEFYKFLDVGTLTPLIIYNTNLLRYAQWALNEGLVFDGQNHFDEFDTELLATCVSMVKKKQSILSYDDFLNLMYRRIINYQDRFIFFCLFEGIKGKNYQDIIDMKMEDIDKKNRVVHLQSGKDVCVPQDFVDIAAEADKQTVYTGLTDSNFEIQLIPSLTIYKQKNNSQGSDPNRTIYNTIVRNINAIDELSEVITSKSIRDSGLIHYLNQRADKLHTTVEEMFVTCDNCRDILEKYNLNPMTRKRWRIQYKEFLR